MAWIESHTVLIRHRKLIDLSTQLRLKPVYVLGHLHALWHSALEQGEDGDLSLWTNDFIAASACFSGDDSRFVSLLESTGWLDEGRLLHDWLDYAGRFLESRYRTSNPDRLVEIWQKHGKTYEISPKQKSKSVFSQTKDGLQSVHLTIPNQPNHKFRRSAASKMEETVLNELTRNESGRRSGTDGDAKRLVPDDDTGTGDRGGKGTRPT